MGSLQSIGANKTTLGQGMTDQEMQQIAPMMNGDTG